MTKRVHVAFTPDEAAKAPVGIVVDVLRATSTIAQALAAGYERVLCAAEIEEARALRRELDDAVVGGEQNAVRIDGFDVGASPREILEPRAATLILSTTNGTRTIRTAAARCDEVLLGSLLNLEAVARAAASVGRTWPCSAPASRAPSRSTMRTARAASSSGLGGDRTDAAIAAELVARAFPSALEALNARTYGPPGLEEDIAFCAREDVLDVVPRLAGTVGAAAEIRV